MTQQTKILVTGAAGFIGFHLCQALLEKNIPVIGVDCLTTYYDIKLKEDRLHLLKDKAGFQFETIDISNKEDVHTLFEAHSDMTHIAHLAAQAGVRYSLINPYAYVSANIEGQVVLLEAARNLENLKHFVYASSSSVYGANNKLPYSIEDEVDNPVSLYAASKKSAELIASTYAHLYRIPATGLRFFTVYGPWGRPDMAYYSFTKAIFEGTPIKIFNKGDMSRDFTYIDDIVEGITAALEHPPKDIGQDGAGRTSRPHHVYNLGNHNPENLLDFVETLEDLCGKKAIKDFVPMQPGDVKATYADIRETTHDLGFMPKTNIRVGLSKFVEWYKHYHRIWPQN